jgi:hypothetical protein
MTSHNLRLALSAAAFASVLTFAACSSDSSGPPTGGGTTLDASEAQVAGGFIAREVEASVTAMPPSGASKYGGESADRAFGLATVAASRVAQPHGVTPFFTTGWFYQGCGVTAPANAPDADEDGIPDDVTVTFSLPACALEGVRSKAEGDVTGSMRLVDQSSSANNNAWLLTVTSLRYAFTNDAVTFGETRNGTRQVTGDSVTITQVNNITTVFDSAGSTATLGSTMGVSFTETLGFAIDMISGLSNGTATVNGGVTYTSSSITDTFTVASVGTLLYNPSCAHTGAVPIETGEIDATVTTAGRTGVMQIVWAHCAVAVVTLEP